MSQWRIFHEGWARPVFNAIYNKYNFVFAYHLGYEVISLLGIESYSTLERARIGETRSL